MTENQSKSPVARRPVLALLIATGLAWFGNVTTLIVVPWLVYQVTGSASQTGMVGFAAAVPLVLSGFFGGVFIDRIGLARTAIGAEFFSGFFLALIPVLHWTTGLNVWTIVVLVFISNMFSAPGMTARRSLIPDVARPAGMSLERANSLEQMVSRLPQLIGPVIAGGLMAVYHPALVIWLAVGVVWLSGLSIFLGVRSVPRPERVESSSYVRELGDALRFLLQDRLIRALAIVLALTNLLESPLSVIAPIYADEVLGGAFDLGLIMAALGSGLILGVASFAVIGYRLPRRMVFITGFIGIGGSYWILATLPGFWVTCAVLFTLGLLAGPVNPLLSTVYHERVPSEMRARVFGLVGATALSMMPLGRLAGGLLIEWIGLSGTLLVQAIGFVFCGAMIITLPALRLLNEPVLVASEPDQSETEQPPETAKQYQ